MPDYACEQAEEVEALQAILMDDLTQVDGRGPEGLGTDSPCYQVVIRPEGEEADSPDIPVLLSLTFAHTPTYPDAPPLLRVRSLRGMSNADVEECQRMLEALAVESLGMAMVFTLSTAAREWLRQRAHLELPADEDAVAEAARRAEEAAEAAREAERAAGTPVTAETYAAWWAAFSAEHAVAEVAVTASKRMTGKSYFDSLRAEAAADEGADAEEVEAEAGEELEELEEEEWVPEEEEDEGE